MTLIPHQPITALHVRLEAARALAQDDPLPRRASLAFTAALLGAMLSTFALLAGGVAALLQRSGLQGSAPGGSSGTFRSLVDTLAENLIWIAGTTITLAIVVIGLMFLFGVQRASDYAFRIGAGVVIIILAPGIAA